jgi:hypothetical protein
MLHVQPIISAHTQPLTNLNDAREKSEMGKNVGGNP